MPARFKVPADTARVPVLASPPFRFSVPPAVVSVPPTVVLRVTLSDPPETLRELPLLMVSAPIVSLPVPWFTA